MKQSLKHITGFLLFLFGFIFLWEGLRYVFVDDTAKLTRLTFHHLYQQDNIDILFIGSSHCYSAIDPVLMDQQLNLNTFNGGSSMQTLDESLLVIKEAKRVSNVNHIYLEMFYSLRNYTRSERSSMASIYLLTDYMKPSFSKYRYLFQETNTQHFINTFFPMRRYKSRVDNLDKMQSIVFAKDSDAYRNFSSIDNYGGKGFLPYPTEIQNWNYFMGRREVSPSQYTEDWKEDLQKIIRFCKENNIELTLFSAPMPEYSLTALSSYDEHIIALQQIIEGTGISYWDFNLCREEYFPCDPSFYADNNHLSYKGAEKFSALFAQFIKGDISPEELFYDSYKEKLHHMDPHIFGIYYVIENGEGGTTYRSCHIVSTPTDNMEYQISIQPADGEPYQIQDYSQNTDFPLITDGAGKVIIRWRINGQPEYTGERIIDFPEKQKGT